MAYVFDSIDQALGGNQAQGQGVSDQSNIFAATPTATTTPQAGGSDVKTSTDGDVATTGASSNTSTAPTTPKDTAAPNDAAAVGKNTQAFSALPSSYQTSFDKINSNLQDEANSYTSAQVAKGSANNVDNTTLASAANGDATAGAKVSQRYNAAAPTVDQYQSGVDTNVAGLDALNTQAGVAGVMARNANSSYTSGLANLDGQLLGQNKDFIAARQNLNQSQAAVKQKVIDDQTNLTKTAQDATTAKFNEGTGQIKDYLTGQEGQLDTAAGQKMAAYNAQALALAKADPAYLAAQKKAALGSLSTQSGPYLAYVQGKQADQDFYDKNITHTPGQVYTNPWENVDVDPSSYYQAPSQVSDMNSFYDQPSASKFNLLESLLGGTGSRAAPVSALAPAAASFNTSGYQNAVTKASQKAIADEKAREAEIASRY